jgi:diaminohydroxyphosphoribosylaminopyrimidine deaminase/5-amino-6-(5-phosphoribosylamino)uracil reductase
MVKNDNYFMQQAIDEAWYYQALTFPNPPVGALIKDKDNKIISIGVHKEAGSAHAELDAVKKALIHYGKEDLVLITEPNKLHTYIIKHYSDFFKEHTIYVTLEPCLHQGKTPPCSILLEKMGFNRLVIAEKDRNKKAAGGMEYLRGKMEVISGVLEDKAKDLLTIFERSLKNKPVIFFKVAISNNGVYTGGVISSKTSRKLVHKIRQKCDLLVIGGESVRTDRPILDTRLADGINPPDILIYSRQKEFDQTIPLFSVKGRKVYICDSLEQVQNYRFIMIEGGAKLFEKLYSFFDLVMIFRTQKELYHDKGYIFEKSLKRLNSFKYFDDTIEWYVKGER